MSSGHSQTGVLLTEEEEKYPGPLTDKRKFINVRDEREFSIICSHITKLDGIPLNDKLFASMIIAESPKDVPKKYMGCFLLSFQCMSVQLIYTIIGMDVIRAINQNVII